MEQENTHNLLFSNASKDAFYDLKEQLKGQYSRLGYTNIAIDKENSFMMKSSTLQNSYIHLKMNEARATCKSPNPPFNLRLLEV